jgi:DNA-binding NarL/FixJ family response regulator
VPSDYAPDEIRAGVGAFGRDLFTKWLSTIQVGALPTEPGESPAIPIFQTCSLEPGGPIGSAPLLEEMGVPGTAPSTPSTPRISIVDDDEELQLFLKDLEGLGHFKIAGSFYTAAQALDGLPLDRPDAVIMDIRLPDSSGIDCANKLKTLLPDLPILILTGYPDRQNFFRSLMGGARGFLVKPVSAQELLSGIWEIIRGEFALARDVTPFLVELVDKVSGIVQRSGLTRREEEILTCLFYGMSDKEIATSLGIGTATVHTHMHRLFEKLGVHSRREIVAKYLQLD